MSLQFRELDRVRVVVDDRVRERHLNAVSEALSKRSRPVRRHGRTLAVVLVLVLLLPVIAFAADDAVPGDLLYPVKRVFEPFLATFDEDAAAKRRVREVEVLFERNAADAVIEERVEVARQEIDEDDVGLNIRVDEVVHRLDERRAQRDVDRVTVNTVDRPKDDWLRDDSVSPPPSGATTNQDEAETESRPADRPSLSTTTTSTVRQRDGG